MAFLTDAQRAQMLANSVARAQGKGIDPYPVVKLFTPDAQCTWLLTEIDVDDQDRAFGLCDLGQGCPELGYVSLREIESLRGTLGLKVERDEHFEADRTLSAYAKLAHERHRLVC